MAPPHSFLSTQAKDRSKKKGADVPVPGGAGGGTVPPEVPLEGSTWFILMAGCCSMALGEYHMARRAFAAAE